MRKPDRFLVLLAFLLAGCYRVMVTPIRPPEASETVSPLATARPSSPSEPPSPSSPPAVSLSPTPTPPFFTPSETPTLLPSPFPSLTAPPTSSPTPAPPLLTAPPAGPVAIWEGTVTLNAYDWERALVPTASDDPVYPHPRLDFGAVGGPAPRSYRAVFIQNDYVQLVVLPDLGGRILRWTDRTTGRQLFYANPVVKPTRWGYRGWWLATGGIEWAFPTEEHGLIEYRPWEYRLMGDGVYLRGVDERSGLVAEVTVRLERGTSRVVISPRVSNPTAESRLFQFWANGMLALSDFNVPSTDLVFVLPVSEVIVHSTGDGSLPGPGGRMAWPVHGGRDFRRYREWRSYLGVFAPQAAEAGFAGAYDLQTDQGVVRVAPPSIRGVKIFCLGDLPPDLWTDDGSRYFELWGGLTATFWDYATLGPGRSVSWTEYWYAVSRMGGYTWANAEGAVRITSLGDGAEVAVETVQPMAATVILRRGNEEAARWVAEVGPGRPFRAVGGTGSGPWTLEVVGPQGLILRTESP
ncbi:MAG: DUF5107 domain-containing protein [Anaerolineae bacterium]|nr:DUF5107 domain-containing protein [Anaerolineae bacterium]MDW8068014.1 DUF5107 domain-containing protein [Anaerolineae bacterium]